MANANVYKMNETTLVRFIELYRSEECLWNTDHPDYKTKDARSKAVERIANRLNITGFGPSEVVHKFKNVRSSYCHELKKMYLSIKRKHSEVYKPKVVWFNAIDSFLKPYCQVQLQGKENQQNEDFSVELVEINESQLVKVASTFEMDNSDGSSSNNSGLNANNGKRESSQLEEVSNKKLRMDNPEFVSIKKDKLVSDDLEAFGRYIVTQLKELPLEFLIQAQNRILQCLTEERVNYFESFATEKDE